MNDNAGVLRRALVAALAAAGGDEAAILAGFGRVGQAVVAGIAVIAALLAYAAVMAQVRKRRR